MMNRQTIEQVRALIAEVDDLARDVLVEMDVANEWEVQGWKKREEPRPASPSDHLMTGSKSTGALRRRSMDLTRKLAELRKGP